MFSDKDNGGVYMNKKQKHTYSKLLFGWSAKTQIINTEICPLTYKSMS